MKSFLLFQNGGLCDKQGRIQIDRLETEFLKRRILRQVVEIASQDRAELGITAYRGTIWPEYDELSAGGVLDNSGSGWLTQDSIIVNMNRRRELHPHPIRSETRAELNTS